MSKRGVFLRVNAGLQRTDARVTHGIPRVAESYEARYSEEEGVSEYEWESSSYWYDCSTWNWRRTFFKLVYTS